MHPDTHNKLLVLSNKLDSLQQTVILMQTHVDALLQEQEKTIEDLEYRLEIAEGAAGKAIRYMKILQARFEDDGK